jgi:hypothetical protein
MFGRQSLKHIADLAAPSQSHAEGRPPLRHAPLIYSVFDPAPYHRTPEQSRSRIL